MKNHKTAIILILLIVTVSCQKQLDLSHPYLTTVEDYWNSAESAEKGTNAVYASLQRKGTYRRWLYFAYDVRSDETYSRSPWADMSNFCKFTLSDYNFEINHDLFQDHYRSIFRANQVITNVPDIDMDEDLKNRFLGEARFLRALMYFNLVNLYGNVPYASTVPIDPSQGFPQKTVEDLWALIISDLEFAQDHLPLSYPSSEVGRATWGAATALLGKAYMQQHEYSKARDEFADVITENIYGLDPVFDNNFKHTSENSIESVFEVQFSDVYENGPDQDGTPTASLGCNRSIFFSPVGWSDAEATEWLVDQFLIEADRDGSTDPRLDASLIYDKPVGPNPVYGVEYLVRFPVGHSKNGSQWLRKYLNDYWKSAENWDSPINFKVIRYADILLLYAEALNETDATAQAYTYIDIVRARSNMFALSIVMPGLTKAEMREQIKHERVVELAGESQRFLDLARWEMLDTALKANDPEFEYFIKGKSELLPIPTRETELNDIIQNPGW